MSLANEPLWYEDAVLYELHGVRRDGCWRQVLNSDAAEYGGGPERTD